jgi:hypothetical protein
MLLIFFGVATASAQEESARLVLHYDFEDIVSDRGPNLVDPQASGALMGGDPEAFQVPDDTPLLNQGTTLFCDPNRPADQITYMDSEQLSSRLGINRAP